MSLMGSKSRCQQNLVISRGSRKNLIFSFLPSKGCWHSLANGYTNPVAASQGLFLCPWLLLCCCCCCTVAKSCPTLCNPMDCSMPGFPALHWLPEFAQTHVHWVDNPISSSVAPFSSCPQFSPASGPFPKSQLFASGGQSKGTSASVLPMSIQGWFPLGLTGLISLLSKGPLKSLLQHHNKNDGMYIG